MSTHTAIVSKRDSIDGRRYTITMMPSDVSFHGPKQAGLFSMDELLTALIPVAADPGTLRTWRGALELKGVLLIDMGFKRHS